MVKNGPSNRKTVSSSVLRSGGIIANQVLPRRGYCQLTHYVISFHFHQESSKSVKNSDLERFLQRFLKFCFDRDDES